MVTVPGRTATHARRVAKPVGPGSFEPQNHFYPRALNAQIHPLVGFFMRMGTDRIANRFCHLNPRVSYDRLLGLLREPPKYLRWAGADLFHVTTAGGARHMVIIETNSCPSGNKSMPITSDELEQGGYRTLVEHGFLPSVPRRGLPSGDLAMLYDKNTMEASGYAAAMADCTGERVWLTPFYAGDDDPPARFDDGVLQVRDEDGVWHPIRAAMRYVTQKPWNRLPVHTKTHVFNPVIGCLAGGRNKLMAAKAYEFYNAELGGTGLAIRTPETIRDLLKDEIPLWVARFGGHAVIKVPYSNAGQGVFTVTSPRELQAFMDQEFSYERFIVQSLIGNHEWSSNVGGGRLYHVGTMPNKRGEIYVADMRMMIFAGPDGFRPLAIYARRARQPLIARLDEGLDSWDMLGTNLSIKLGEDQWDSDTDRLMLMDRKDFNVVGAGLDDLIEGFIQTVLSVIAIDRMAQNLITQKGKLRRKLFQSLNDDAQLIEELGP